jgi:predicted O-methyltransferase YrrM
MSPDPKNRARSAVFAVRTAVRQGFCAAAETGGTAYVSFPHAEAFALAWEKTSLVPGWLAETEAAVLFETVQQVRPRTVVEIGSYLGRSTVLLGLAQRAAGLEAPRLVAIDPHTGDRQHLEQLGVSSLPSFDLFKRHVDAVGLGDLVEARVAPSAEVGRSWSEPIDMLFVDGWHSFEAVCQDGHLFLPHVRDNGVVIFDDYRNYPEVAEAVASLEGEGLFYLWGRLFGQALGGRARRPGAELERMLRPWELRRRLRRMGAH